MKYVEFVNNEIKKIAAAADNLVLFGQNINAGSFVSGFTKNLKVKPSGRILNTTNTENALVGFGLGLMLAETPAVYFMKQLDFLLLGIDQLVNTYNIIRNSWLPQKGSFTLMPIVVDNGYQGPQSSLNNLGDFCSIGRIPGFTITNSIDAEAIISRHMIAPGFRIIAVSQRLFGQEIITPQNCLYKNSDLSLFQYEEGKDATVVCFNFSLPYGMELLRRLRENNLSASLFNVNSPTPIDWNKIIDDVKKTGRIVIIDDSKSANQSHPHLLNEISRESSLKNILTIVRNPEKFELRPQADALEINYEEIVNKIKN